MTLSRYVTLVSSTPPPSKTYTHLQGPKMKIRNDINHQKFRTVKFGTSKFVQKNLQMLSSNFGTQLFKKWSFFVFLFNEFLLQSHVIEFLAMSLYQKKGGSNNIFVQKRWN